jgi:hypothetical protein
MGVKGLFGIRSKRFRTGISPDPEVETIQIMEK